jgi:crossover junction endonuclease MUS81
MIRLDHDDFINLRKVEYLASQRNHPFAKQLRLVEPDSRMRDGLETIYGFVVEDGAPPTCSKFDDAVSAASNNPAKKRASDQHEILDQEAESKKKRPSIDRPTNASSFPLSPPPETTFTRTSSAPSYPPTGMSSLAAQAALRRVGGLDALGRSASSSAISLPANAQPKPRAGPRLSSHVQVRAPMIHLEDAPPTPTLDTDFNPDDAIVFKAGTFDIILVLDAREIESKSTRDNFGEALRSRGILVETRALRLGDMLWVARRRDGMGGEEDECVLDYVVERKRLDDLCTSIKDGRYNEQCVSVRKYLSRPLCTTSLQRDDHTPFCCCLDPTPY